MHTNLSRFSQHFDNTVRPLVGPLGAAVGALSKAPAEAQRLRTELADLRHLIRSLVDKVAEQQAYVLIFGPLKSGKSTLMNALAAAYVSEVSSLPAYPCLVFVRHGKRREYSVTTYEGATTTFTDARLLQDLIEDAHKDLAKAIRTAEEEGGTFDPDEHYRSAIRRVDVMVPAPDLEGSGAVLVDTPGLYTRMRFGYDRMTKDFRNSAATAVFVVKSENLFLEQVFTEFQQLLELFSRIFLVVNMDTNKRDVGPDGTLVPALEQRNPRAIIEAFENLAMTPPLRAAAEEGRLRIHPVDLMSAARSTLTSNERVTEDFAAFHKELTDYLGSPDYLKAFLGDSLRRGHSLVGEIASLCGGEAVRPLRDQHAELSRRIRATEASLAGIEALDRLGAARLSAGFAQALEEELKRQVRDHGAKLARTMGAALNTWFLSSHSLKHLLASEWDPMVQDFWNAVQDAARRLFERSCNGAAGGLDLPDAAVELLDRLGIDVADVRRRTEAAAPPAAHPAEPLTPIAYDEIPLRRGILDLVAFRATDVVRERLFGPADNPDRKIPARTKAARLGEPAQHAMRGSLLEFHKELQPQALRDSIRRWTAELDAATLAAIQRHARAAREQLQAHRQKLVADKSALETILDPIEALQEQATDVHAKVHALATQYAGEDAATLLAEADGVVLQPQSPPPREAPPPGRRGRTPRVSAKGRGQGR